MRRYLRDVRDHALRVTDKVVSLVELLQNILSVNLTLVNLSQNEEVTKLTQVSLKQTEEVNNLTQASIAQNDQVKKISAWAAILVVPTIVTGIYGMNFDYMPGAALGAGIPLRPRADDPGLRRPLLDLQTPRLAVALTRRRPSRAGKRSRAPSGVLSPTA